MVYRKKSIQEDEQVKSGAVARQNLPRKCKINQPFYGEDTEKDEPKKRKKVNLQCSSNNTDSKTEEDIDSENITILAWLIDMKVVNENALVKCFNADENLILGEGRITRGGIFCFCCSAVIPASKFPHHSGDNSVDDKPYQNIFVGNTGISLLTCQIEAWNRHSLPARNGYNHAVKKLKVRDHHDDVCLICADGGDLMCCDNCPSTYHPKCIGFEGVPKDEWHCPYCNCRYCDQDFPPLLSCHQCLKKFHGPCTYWVQPSSICFCGQSCWQVFRNMEGMVGRAMPVEPGVSWKLVRRMDLDAAGLHSDDLHSRATCNSLVALAAILMEDSFKLIIDRQTKTNTMQSVTYSCGSNFIRTNFSRFYTAVLQKDGKVVTVASLRLPSPEVAEIPLTATAESWRNKGYCKMLLLSLESALAAIGVRHILVPSAEDMVMKWQQSFGYTPIDEAMKKRIATFNALMFPRTTRLQKDILNQRKQEIQNQEDIPNQRKQEIQNQEDILNQRKEDIPNQRTDIQNQGQEDIWNQRQEDIPNQRKTTVEKIDLNLLPAETDEFYQDAF